MNCGLPCHAAKDCRGAKRDAKDRPCFRCGEKGHISRDCKKKMMNVAEVQSQPSSPAPFAGVSRQVLCVQKEGWEPIQRGRRIAPAHVAPAHVPQPTVPTIGAFERPPKVRQGERKRAAKLLVGGGYGGCTASCLHERCCNNTTVDSHTADSNLVLDGGNWA